jgi:hypothetical protein
MKRYVDPKAPINTIQPRAPCFMLLINLTCALLLPLLSAARAVRNCPEERRAKGRCTTVAARYRHARLHTEMAT